MDTDSYYFSISGDCLEDVVKPELKDEFNRVKVDWFPQDKYDQRTPGKFKLEYKGDGIVSLCSKCYFCWGEESTKCSTKGLNKSQNVLTKEIFLNVLETRKNGSGSNRSFRVRDNAMWTYTQQRDALSYFYPKRKVLNDGLSTGPLDI